MILLPRRRPWAARLPALPLTGGAAGLPMLTTAEIAKALSVTGSRVRALARSRCVQPLRTIGRANLWPADAVERLRPRASGYRGHAANQSPVPSAQCPPP